MSTQARLIANIVAVLAFAVPIGVADWLGGGSGKWGLIAGLGVIIFLLSPTRQ